MGLYFIKEVLKVRLTEGRGLTEKNEGNFKVDPSVLQIEFYDFEN